MKRDLDLMRQLLIQAEETNPGDVGSSPWRTFGAPGASRDAVIYHVRLLQERGFLHPPSVNLESMHENGTPAARFLPDALTDQGHDFLATIRDDAVWKKTKTRLKKVGGASALDVVKDVAKEVARRLILGA